MAEVMDDQACSVKAAIAAIREDDVRAA